MKVLHVSTPLSWRGGEQQATYLCHALKDLHLEVSMLCPENSAMFTQMKDSRIKVLTFKKRGFLDLSLAKTIAKACKSSSFDLIHTHDSHAHSAAVLSATVFGNALPIVVSRRVDFSVSATPFSKWKYNHASVKKIICVSATIKKMTEPSIVNPEKLCIVHSGIDVAKYNFSQQENILKKELNIPEEVCLIGNLSALADHKDFPTFMNTAKATMESDPKIQFIIAGSGAEEAYIKKFISDHQLQNKIHLLGFRKDVPKVMKSLDIFLITSKTEGLGTIVLEAFAAGVPVVATRAGGIPELVNNGVTGLLNDVGDVNGLKNSLLKILGDRELKMHLANNAKIKVADFTYKATAEKTLKIYYEVLGK